MPAMVDSVFVDFLGKVAWGFGVTLAVLAVVALSIPARAPVARPTDKKSVSR